MRDELHAEDLLRGFLSFVRILDDFDAAAFAASARMNLRFDDDGSPPSATAVCLASSGVKTTPPFGSRTAYFLRISLPWYS